MIRKGDMIENPVTGERMLFLETSADTNGEYVLVEVTVQPNGFVAAAHTHPYQTERFEIESGTIAFKLDGKEIVAGPGETVVVPPKSSHKFWNAGDTKAVFVCASFACQSARRCLCSSKTFAGTFSAKLGFESLV